MVREVTPRPSAASHIPHATGEGADAKTSRRPRGRTEVQFRLRIHKGHDIAIGPGKVDLLEAIGVTGSITAAAKALGMSYRRAWLLVATMNRCFGRPVVSAATGGSHGGGARVTSLGAQIVRRYRRIEANAAKAAAADLAALTRLLR